MAFRGFTEEDLREIEISGVEKDSESDYEEREEVGNSARGRVGASVFFSGRGKRKIANNVSVKCSPMPEVEVPKEALLSNSELLSIDATTSNDSGLSSKGCNERVEGMNTSNESDSVHSSDARENRPILDERSNSLDDSSNDVDFADVKLVLQSSFPSPSAIGVKLDLATVKSLPLDWDNTASLNALIEFEQNRKRLEDLNEKKKTELKKALEEKAKKTEEDMKKISEISQELKQLDSNLSNDVSILRKQIEIASWDFNDAQKRFDKAEKEYLEAKLELFTKREKKELLTGHLCSIIEQNEFRKAKKLSDLMGQLEVGSKEIVQQVNSERACEVIAAERNAEPLPT